MGNEMKVVDYARGEAHRDIMQPIQAWGADEQPCRYEPSRKHRWISLGLIASLHAVGFLTLRYIDVGVVRPVVTAPLVIDLLPLDPPPPQPDTLPTEKAINRAPLPQRVIVPPPIVALPIAPVALQTTAKPEPPLPMPVKVEDASPAPSQKAEMLMNLNTRLLSADPPRYPIESRRRREIGIVVLMVVVDEEGRVGSISIAESSGVDRLDKAALTAVRRWQWSPTVVDGRPIEVRGLVRIPFELKEAR